MDNKITNKSYRSNYNNNSKLGSKKNISNFNSTIMNVLNTTNMKTNETKNSNQKLSLNMENLTTSVDLLKKVSNDTLSSSIAYNKNLMKSKTINTKNLNRLKANNNLNNSKSIKQEIFDDIRENMENISPKHDQNMPFKGRTDCIISLKNLPRIYTLDEKTRNINLNIDQASSSGIQMSRITKFKLQQGNKILQEFAKTNIVHLDENTIKHNLHLPETNKNYSLMHEFSNKHRKLQKINYELKQEQFVKDSNRWKIFEGANKNPSLGPEFIRKNYKDMQQFHTKFIGYENHFKINYLKKTLNSALFASRVCNDDDSNKYENVKNNKLTQMSKLKMKWKTIKWIIDNKKDVLDRLVAFHETFLKISNTKAKEINKGFSKAEFTTIMKKNGITNDRGLINKLFWVFDEDGDNDLRYQEILFGIEMFTESSIEQKLKAFFDLCDEDGSGSISKTEFYNLMKKNMINNDEKVTMKNIIDKLFLSVKLNKNGEITLDELKEACEKNKELQDIIYKNLHALKAIDNMIDKDIKNDIIKFNPELNDQLRMKLLSTRISFIPLREEKIIRLVDEFITNKQKVLEIHKQRENNEDSFEEGQADVSLFKEEQEFVRRLETKVSLN